MKYSAIFIFYVKTPAPNPYLESFALLIASSFVLNGVKIDNKGPNISSLATYESSGTSLKMIGGQYNPFSGNLN